MIIDEATTERQEVIEKTKLTEADEAALLCAKAISDWTQVQEFVRNHADKLNGTCFSASPNGVRFYLWEWKKGEKDPRAIARRWPGVAWKRVAASGQCGICDWETEWDGIRLSIAEAEKMKWVPAIDAPAELSANE